MKQVKNINRTFLLITVGVLVITSIIFVSGVIADSEVSEEEFIQPAPERGDPYFEATAPDGSWISYDNPRDEYRSPYLGEGSAKICIALHNENGEPIVGESIPNTTVTVPTGDSLSWHSSTDPITVQLPLTDHYDHPLDSDQFGTSDLPQGDGYLDSHCYEFHGLPNDDTITYAEAEIDGEHADEIDVVGYHQQTHAAWDSDVDPIADAESYEDVGGGWTFQPEASHGQVTVVLQLDTPEDDATSSTGVDETNHDIEDESGEVNENEGVTQGESIGIEEDHDSDPSDSAAMEHDTDTEPSTNQDDEMPGFGVIGALVALAIIVLARTQR